MNLSYEVHKALYDKLIDGGVVERGGYKVTRSGKIVTTDRNEDNLGNLREYMVKIPKISYAQTKTLAYPEAKSSIVDKPAIEPGLLADIKRNLLKPDGQN